MSLIDLLSDASVWERFYEYKTRLICPKELEKRLRRFIDGRGYIPVCDEIAAGRFPLPKMAIISKIYSQKKRTVYTYPEAENTVLKLLTYLLLRKYDGLFSPNLFSFRPGRTAKDALTSLLRVRGIGAMYSYKVDVSNYFNSIPIPSLLPELQAALYDDGELYGFLVRLLSEPCALDNGRPVEEQKGIMAGTPLASFYANLYLKELDRHFYEAGVPYARYSDDIILFAPTREEVRSHAEFVRSFLAEKGLAVNPSKEEFRAPEGGLAHASELVRLVKARHADICCGVAGYPEMHPESASAEEDVRHLKEKLDEGAEFVNTQLFFDNDVYFRFRDRCDAAGIRAPVFPAASRKA